jgi:uncharacterized membrane protein
LKTGIIKFHRFLISQSLYPIVLSSVVALAFFVVRTLHNPWNSSNLVWNLVLAWVPYIFSSLTAGLFLLFPRHWWLLLPPGFIWLIFFPNAPYLLTDFQHLTHRPPTPMWYDVMLIATFAWTGCFMAIVSLKTMQYLVSHYLGRIVGWLFAAATLALCGLGIYLGRFSRWNSWDLIFRPEEILYDIALRFADPVANLRFFVFTVMFTIFLTVLYLMFVSITHVNELDRFRNLQKSDRKV